VGGQLGIDAGATKKIEGNEGLGEEAVPKMQGEIRVRGTEASNKVILEGAYGSFGGITTVQMGGGGCQLKVDVFRGHEGLEGGRGFVVEALKLWTQAALGKQSVSTFVGGQNLGSGLVPHEFDMDGVAIVIVKNKHVVVAGTGGSEETARLVRVDLTGNPLVGNKDMVCACDGGGGGVGRVKVRHSGGRWFRRDGGTDRGKLGGAKVRALLVKVALDHGGGTRWILADLAGGKFWKSRKMAGVEGLAPWPGALFLHVALVWRRFLLVPWVQQ
jgi:hypothetical protein